MTSNRRKFLQQAGLFTFGLGTLIHDPAIAKAAKKAVPPSDKIRIGLIGSRSMGFYDLTQALKQPEAECVALCDIDDSVLAEKKKAVLEYQETEPATYKDYRKFLEHPDLDAVVIGTPDHWHCLTMVAACEAGKDVYVEKPMANSIAELDIMVNAARKNNRVVQVGQQQRSGTHWREIMDMIHGGEIGQLRKVNIWGNFEYGIGQPEVPDSAPPEGVDFDMWLGPAPDRTFNKARFHGSWRMFWDYGGGLATDWGVHLIDMALWAGKVDYDPVNAVATGGNFAFPDHAHETFDTMSVSWQLKDYNMTWEHSAGLGTGPYGKNYGLAFIGNDATIFANREGWEVHPEVENGKYKVPAMPPKGGRSYHEEHMKNFLECIKTRKDPNCTVENGRLVALYAHSANIALRTGGMVAWDSAGRQFKNNDAANALVTPGYRKPWKLPRV